MVEIVRLVDFETTGIPTEDDPQAVCEVGWCDVMLSEGSWRVGLPQAMLVNPGRPIPPEVRAVHHISDEDVSDAPAIEVGFRALMDGIDPNTSCFAAHNADFEREFFGGGDVSWICTYKAALRIWPDAKSHSNQVLRYVLDLPVDHDMAMPPHRAGPDAYVTSHLLARMLNDGADIGQMIRWSNGPALLPKITFGKHRGAKWDEVPISYLEWVVDKSDLNRDVKANAKHWLKQRRA